MLFVQIGILAILLLVIPMIVGSLFEKMDNTSHGPLFWWLGGQMVLWAGFQLICVPFILKEGRFESVLLLFGVYMGVLVVAAIFRFFHTGGKLCPGVRGVWRQQKKSTVAERVLWIACLVILLFQLVQAVRLTYADWDDAFYVAISSITEDANTMYQKLPYTGGATLLDARHGLAPFPIWIALLARVSGVPAVTVAHVVIPVVLIAMAYGIYLLLGQRLLRGKSEKLPLFLLFSEILVLFGNYSIYSVENFMIARSRQGKAALGSLIVPTLFLLLLLLFERLQEKRKVTVDYWILLLAVMLSSCLCSTMGAALSCMLLLVAGGLGAVCYRRWKLLLPVCLCCVPCGVFVLLYLVLR